MATAWRLLVTEALDGATNMAIDEALLRARVSGAAPPTVRFYGWDPPAVSLGYGQPLDDRIDLAACARLGIGIVRRPTGGSAILHEAPDREVTYSVTARAGDAAGLDEVLATYEVVGAGLAAGLRELGLDAKVVPLIRAGRRPASPAFCFARTGSYEIAVGGKKLVGSAQRRQAGAVLQHGSLLLDADAGRLRAVFPGSGDPLAGVTTVAAVLGRRLGFDTVAAALGHGLGERLGQPLVPGGLSGVEAELVERLVAEKYATEAWTAKAEVTVGVGARAAR